MNKKPEIRKSTRNPLNWVVDFAGPGRPYINVLGVPQPQYCDHPTKTQAQEAFELYLAKQGTPRDASNSCGVCQYFRGSNVSCRKNWNTSFENQRGCPDFTPSEPTAVKSIRQFSTGATRDTREGKLSYVKGLSPIVLRRYLQYLDKHRLQPDGTMREFDNWKKGIDLDTYLDSVVRHTIADWLLSEGYAVEDNHGSVDPEDALCGILFNTMGKLHEILKGKVAQLGGEPECSDS